MNELILNSVHHLPEDSSGCHQVSPTAWYSILIWSNVYLVTKVGLGTLGFYSGHRHFSETLQTLPLTEGHICVTDPIDT